MLNSAKKYGLAEEYNLSCDKCNYTVSSNTSKRTFVNQKSSAYDVNVRSVLASQSMGHTALDQFCATMDLPNPIHVAPYTKIQKGLSQSAQEVADDIMKDAGVRLFNHMKTGEPDKIKSTKFGDLAYVPVTVDGTWQKRGHSSKTGVIFVLSVHTGEILDYELKTLFCQACNIHPPTSPDYENWKKKHSPHCNINHVGSSGKMESDGATEIFCRSIEKHNLVYSTFVGDGDTGTFGRVKEACFVKYGDIYPVEKEECVGHIQKRMGKGLRDYKKSMTSKTLAGEKKKGVGGAGKLTDNLIDRMQCNFGDAIRANTGDRQGMFNAIWAIYKHRIRNDDESLDVQHDNCPRDGWCLYWKCRKNYNDSIRLPHVFIDELRPLFSRLSEDTLLDRCLRGWTQNQNEAANQILWSKCSKTKFCGRDKLLLATCESIAQYNTGAASKALVLKKRGVHAGENVFLSIRKTDSVRINKAARKVKKSTRLKRRKLRSAKKSKTKEKVSYMTGGFGLSKKPESLITFDVNKPPQPPKKRANEQSNGLNINDILHVTDIPIIFIDEDYIDVIKLYI